MLAKCEINVDETDWECLHLLSKKENIPIPELIGKLIANELEEYEDFQDAIRLAISEKNSEGMQTYTHEEFWALVDTK